MKQVNEIYQESKRSGMFMFKRRIKVYFQNKYQCTTKQEQCSALFHINAPGSRKKVHTVFKHQNTKEQDKTHLSISRIKRKAGEKLI